MDELKPEKKKKLEKEVERGRERVADWQGIGARWVRRMRGLRAV